jgi:lactate dehydrogenase-like 2-hydroxyacid dehydrogenase
MARDADYLVLTVPGGPETRHLVNAAVIDALGPEGTLINVARGSVVDETALVDALCSGRLGAAGLDVYENEPQVPEALLTMDNVVLLPHIGSATRETRAAMGELTVANLRAHFAGQPVLTRVA